MVDTEVLGYVIPKGTQIFMVSTCFFFLFLLLPNSTRSRKSDGEKCRAFNYSFVLTKTIFFLPQNFL